MLQTDKRIEDIALKAILFDMDGTLFDSMPFHAKAWNKAMKNAGLDFSEYDVYLNEGRTGNDTINEAYNKKFGTEAPEEIKREIYREKSEIFNSFPEPKPIKGAQQLIEKLKKHNVKLMIVTGSGQTSLLERINKIFPNTFKQSDIITAFDVTKGKPHPEPYLKALERAGIKASEAIVIENAPMGIISAKNAGIFTIAIKSGILSKETLYENGASIVADSMQEIYEILKKIKIG